MQGCPTIWLLAVIASAHTLTSTHCVHAGVKYQQRNDLSQGTILLQNADLAIVNSTFNNLAFFGQSSLILVGSTVDFDNVTFQGNVQAQAGAILINASSSATIYNSRFLDNIGYNAGAISVACKRALPSCRLRWVGPVYSTDCIGVW